MDTTYLSHSPATSQWHRIGIKHHHGVNVPLFSLHSNRSQGIGEYLDLLILIDWVASVGMDVIQLLPLNDTGLGSSPYSAISAFALNPLFLSLSELPYLNEYPELQVKLQLIPKQTQSGRVDYQRVRDHKEDFFEHYYHLVGQRVTSTDEYQQFLQDAASWIKDDAVFRILKEQNQWIDWESWPEEERSPTKEFIDRIISENQDHYYRYGLIQFLCDKQMKKVYDYAEQKGVLLMGDIPILIDRDSGAVWSQRHLFNMNYSAGSPPDMYSAEGQNWGFPIYDWEGSAKENFSWWKERLKWSSRYYHIYRIDHVVGFFRIWSIPTGHRGNEGHFIPQDARTWVDQGQKMMLLMLEASPMLPIGEDLGIVPDEVRTSLNALGICGTRVMRWERKWKEQSQYKMLHEYQPCSLTTVSTHDSETLKQWWMNFPDEAMLFSEHQGWSYHPILNKDYHKDILWESHHTNSLFHINLLSEYLALIPGLSHDEINEERINVPGVVSDSNWTYRLHCSLEELSSNLPLKHLIQEILTSC